MLSWLKINKTNVFPLDLIPLASGFYVGYQHSQGINPVPNQGLALYGPTIATVGFVSSISLMTRKLAQYVLNNKEKVNKINDQRVEEMTQAEYEEKFEKVRETLDMKLSNTRIAKNTAKKGAIAGIETAIGYFAGNILGNMYK